MSIPTVTAPIASTQQGHPVKLLSLDIETDTSPLTDAEKAAGFTSRGLVPEITPVTAVAFADENGARAHHLSTQGNERHLLAAVAYLVHAFARQHPDAVLVTWNRSVFDLPFLADRARIVGLGEQWYANLELTPDPSFVPKYEPLPGHDGGYAATWNGLRHIDMAYVDKDECLAAGVSWSLKPWAKHLGMDPVEVDRTRMHELTAEELDAYVTSDAVITHGLAARHGARLTEWAER